MKIAIGNDHIVTDIKNQVVEFLESLGHEVIDCGTSDNIRTHFPIYGMHVAVQVVSGKADKGIVICGTGVGISNSASKVKGARVALVKDAVSARIAREELDANIIGFGGRIIGIGLMSELIKIFLETEFKNNSENQKNVKLLNNLIKNQISLSEDKQVMEEEIKKWEEGFYTEGEKQVKIQCK